MFWNECEHKREFKCCWYFHISFKITKTHNRSVRSTNKKLKKYLLLFFFFSRTELKIFNAQAFFFFDERCHILLNPNFPSAFLNRISVAFDRMIGVHEFIQQQQKKDIYEPLFPEWKWNHLKNFKHLHKCDHKCHCRNLLVCPIW